MGLATPAPAMTGTGGRYRGAATVKQSDFGITPVSVETIRVKDASKSTSTSP
jgi:hypothetical protein